MRHKKAVQITLDGFYYMDYKLISSLQKPCERSNPTLWKAIIRNANGTCSK